MGGGAIAARQPLLAQCRPLHDAKAVLLVYDDEAQSPEVHLFLNQGMRTHYDVYVTGGDLLVQADLIAVAQAAGEETHFGRHGQIAPALTLALGLGEQGGNGFVVLLGQDFRGGHDCRLEAVVYRHQESRGCHHGLAGTHLALQQPGHGLSFMHVGQDFAESSLLSTGEGER